MDTRIKERCIYCGGDVYYHGDESLIRCDWCGQTIPVMKFQSEMTRMKRTEEENVLIKEQLKEAEKEKQVADDRLFAALSNLGEIRNEQDTLGKVMHKLTEGQGDALQSLEFLKGISEKLVTCQNDIFAKLDVMQDIRMQLQKRNISEQERQSVMNEFMMWSQQIREEDLKRLQGIASSADTLIEGQREISGKVDELKIAADQHQQTLEAFRTQYTRDKLEKIQKLYRQAENYQHDCMYDKAEEYYRMMLTEGEEDAEVYWRLIMCHYCMFYEKDNDGRLIPIILNPDLTDPAEMSLRKELASHMAGEERSFYEVKLQEIDRILDKYRLLKAEAQYDVFISVKQDDAGHYTSDSDVASDLYDFLACQGLRVFNSRRTPIPAGHEYEPYIISALISAKVLIVVGTSSENMESKWVRNEWSRFQWMQFRDKEKTGKTERVLFCYLAKGMQANQIPRALHPDKQAIYDGVKAHDELLSAIAFLKKREILTGGSGYRPISLSEQDYGKIKNQMTLWLVRGKYDKVLEKYEQLNEEGLFLSHVSLHMAALCANSRVADIMQIIHSDFILEDAPEYKAAVLLCDDEKEKQELEELLARNRAWRNKQAEKDREDSPKDVREVMVPDSIRSICNDDLYTGKVVKFGRYPQTAEGTDRTPIEWLVLEQRKDRLLLLSRYGLDAKPYHNQISNLYRMSWGKSIPREWLNNDFIRQAFTEEEQKYILMTEAEGDKDGVFDKIHLLSQAQARQYLGVETCKENIRAMCAPTAFAIHAGASTREKYKTEDDKASASWWLLHPGIVVEYDGSPAMVDDLRISDVCVRPAIWISIASESGNMISEG